MKKNKWTTPKVIPFIGEFQQLFVGASVWISMFTFTFAAVAAYNTPTMGIVKEFIPWLDLPIMLVIIVITILALMFLQHKYIQASVLAYFNKMQYMSNPLNKDVAENHKEILVVKLNVADNQKEILEVKAIATKILNEKITK